MLPEAQQAFNTGKPSYHSGKARSKGGVWNPSLIYIPFNALCLTFSFIDFPFAAAGLCSQLSN